MRPTMSFYSLFYKRGYSRNSIDAAVEKLDEYDKRILMKKYNQNLALPPVKDNLTPQERTYFYGTLLNNVKKHLVNSEDTKENSNQNIDLLLLDILPSPIFKEEMKKLGIEDAYSKLISLGVDFSKISIEEISKYLKVPSSVIRTTMIYVLNIYRETLNSNIDIATKVATGKIKVKKN